MQTEVPAKQKTLPEGLSNLSKRLAELQEQLEQAKFSDGPDGWEQKYTVNEGETPWWKIEDRRERTLVGNRQGSRKRREVDPEYYVKARGKNCERHPGRALEAVKVYFKTPRGRVNAAKARAKRREHSTDPEAYATRVELLHTLREPCAICHTPYLISHQIDHIVALCLGGTDDWDNLEPLCVKCHRKKTVEDLDELASVRRRG